MVVENTRVLNRNRKQTRRTLPASLPQNRTKKMKGKTEFNQIEVYEIKKLVKQKELASTSEQKNIRGKIRRLGFYYSDYSSKKENYNLNDFEALIKNGSIKIIGEKTIQNQYTKSIEEKPIKNPTNNFKNNKSISEIELMLILNKSFYFAKDIDSKVPNSTGFYCIKLSDKSRLTEKYQAILEKRDNRILYIGKAEGQTLRKRFLNQELRAIGHGTFFRSIGAVLGKLPIEGHLKGKANQNNYKFGLTEKNEIIKWINENLQVNWIEYNGDFSIERELIIKYKPLLNNTHNPLKLIELEIDKHKCREFARL